MWLAKIRKRKYQFILTAIILAVVALILSTCVIITNDVNNYVNDYYEDSKDVILFENSIDEAEQVEEYLQKNGLDYYRTVGYSIEQNVYHNGKSMSITLGYITVVEDINKNPWDIVIVDGEEKTSPEENEVWVPKIIADAWDIVIGDEISIKNGDQEMKYTVTAFVNDALEPTSIMGINNFYVNSDISEIMDESMQIQLFGYDCSMSPNETYDDICDYVGHSLSASTMTKDAISNVAKISTVAIGGIGLIASILIFVVAIIIIRFILWNSILKEYKSIGIYKAVGYSSKKISGIYLRAYGLTGILAIVVGSILSIYVSSTFVKRIVKYIGEYQYNRSGIVIVMLSAVLLGVVYIFTLYRLLNRVKMIKPIEALTVGATKSNTYISKSVIRNNINPFALAVNDVFKYKKQNFLIGLVFTLVAFLALLFVNVDYSIANIDQNLSQWFGNMTGDFIIDTYDYDGSYEDIVSYLKEDVRVSGCRYGNYGINFIISIDIDKYGIKNSELVYCVYNEYTDNEEFDCCVLEGRNPDNGSEVALSQQILKETGMNIGDTIVLNVDGEDKEFEITGSFASIYNNSYCFRVTSDAIPEELQSMIPINVLVSMKDSDDYDALAWDIENEFTDTVVTKIPVDIENGLSDLEIVSPISKLILISVVFFSLLNIINIVVMNKSDNRKNYGIMKAIGFPCKSIILRTVIRIAIISCIAMILGYFCNILLADIIFMTAVVGVDGLLHSWGRDVLTVSIIFILIIVVTAMSLLSIRKISTVELMEE